MQALLHVWVAALVLFAVYDAAWLYMAYRYRQKLVDLRTDREAQQAEVAQMYADLHGVYIGVDNPRSVE